MDFYLNFSFICIVLGIVGFILLIIYGSLKNSHRNKRERWGIADRQPYIQRKVILSYRPYYSDLLPDSYVVFDLETSGLDPAKYEILEIGAIRYEQGVETGRFHTYVKPSRSIPRSATQINGITAATVQCAPRFAEKGPEFLEFTKGLPLVAHNARFDMHFLQTELGQYVENEVIDTLRLARDFIPTENHKLETLKKYFGVKASSHSALGDCVVTAQVYQWCVPLAKERWLKNRPPIDKSIPTDVDKLNETAATYYKAIEKALLDGGKNVDDTNVSLFKNKRDFAVNINRYRLYKVTFSKSGAKIYLYCTVQEAQEALASTGLQYTDSGYVTLPDQDSIQLLAPILCRKFDEIRQNYQ